jgi:Family of unknown function (DUF6282)
MSVITGPVDVFGAIDIHVHSNPSLMERAGDDFHFARLCRDAGMAGILLKAHEEPTVSRAYLAEKATPGIRVFGGIVLNWGVGGLNPLAVETQLLLGGKQVWMPSFHSAAHARLYGFGTYGYQSPGIRATAEPISIHDGEGRLKREVMDILALCKGFDVILSSCHLSPPEIFDLARAAKSEDFDKLLITHPSFKPPDLTVDQAVELAGMGCWIEIAAGSLYWIPGHGSLKYDLELIGKAGTDRLIISSDSGQFRKSPPPEVIRVYCQNIYEKGVGQADVTRMTRTNVRTLLDWPE